MHLNNTGQNCSRIHLTIFLAISKQLLDFSLSHIETSSKQNKTKTKTKNQKLVWFSLRQGWNIDQRWRKVGMWIAQQDPWGAEGNTVSFWYLSTSMIFLLSGSDTLHPLPGFVLCSCPSGFPEPFSILPSKFSVLPNSITNSQIKLSITAIGNYENGRLFHPPQAIFHQNSNSNTLPGLI